MSEIEARGFDAVLSEAIEQALDGPEAIYLSRRHRRARPRLRARDRHAGAGRPDLVASCCAPCARSCGGCVSSGMDVVEVAPAYDGPGQITAEVAHRLVLEALSALAKKRS